MLTTMPRPGSSPDEYIRVDVIGEPDAEVADMEEPMGCCALLCKRIGEIFCCIISFICSLFEVPDDDGSSRGPVLEPSRVRRPASIPITPTPTLPRSPGEESPVPFSTPPLDEDELVRPVPRAIMNPEEFRLRMELLERARTAPVEPPRRREVSSDVRIFCADGLEFLRNATKQKCNKTTNVFFVRLSSDSKQNEKNIVDTLAKARSELDLNRTMVVFVCKEGRREIESSLVGGEIFDYLKGRGQLRLLTVNDLKAEEKTVEYYYPFSTGEFDAEEKEGVILESLFLQMLPEQWLADFEGERAPEEPVKRYQPRRAMPALGLGASRFRRTALSAVATTTTTTTASSEAPAVE